MKRFLAAVILVPALAACVSVKGLGDSESSLLSESERGIVREQVEKAREDRRWGEAWNQEIDAGAERDRLEAIALDALADESTQAASMFEELFEKWGSLTPEGRSRVTSLVNTAVGERRWKQAVDIELAAADDAPEFTAAFELYRGAPPHKAPEMLEQIKRAREDRQ